MLIIVGITGIVAVVWRRHRSCVCIEWCGVTVRIWINELDLFVSTRWERDYIGVDSLLTWKSLMDRTVDNNVL